MDMQQSAVSVYRLSLAHVIRLVAPFELLIGVAWIVTALIGPGRGWLAALGVVTVAVAVAGVFLLVRPPRVLTLTADGYRLGAVPGVGRREASWREVESVGTADAAGVPVLLVRLAGGGRSALRLSLLSPRGAEAQRDVHERLNSAFGYRRP
jgi:hypothetical protein